MTDVNFKENSTIASNKLYKCGDWFTIGDLGYCILAQVAPRQYAFIDVVDGNRVTEAMEIPTESVKIDQGQPWFTLSQLYPIAGAALGTLTPISGVRIEIFF